MQNGRKVKIASINIVSTDVDTTVEYLERLNNKQ